jgi:hypothetical protein
LSSLSTEHELTQLVTSDVQDCCSSQQTIDSPRSITTSRLSTCIDDDIDRNGNIMSMFVSAHDDNNSDSIHSTYRDDTKLIHAPTETTLDTNQPLNRSHSSDDSYSHWHRRRRVKNRTCLSDNRRVNTDQHRTSVNMNKLPIANVKKKNSKSIDTCQ